MERVGINGMDALIGVGGVDIEVLAVKSVYVKTLVLGDLESSLVEISNVEVVMLVPVIDVIDVVGVIRLTFGGTVGVPGDVTPVGEPQISVVGFLGFGGGIGEFEEPMESVLMGEDCGGDDVIAEGVSSCVDSASVILGEVDVLTISRGEDGS